MSRLAWILPIVAVLALTLVSCFDDVGDCPSCPPSSSGSITIAVDQNGLVDSVHVSVDAGARVTIKRKGQHQFTGLSAGTHAVETTRYFNDQGIVSSRAETIDLHLERGESRTILFHNDFPLITWIVRPAWASA
jgi:hypothetical protein